MSQVPAHQELATDHATLTSLPQDIFQLIVDLMVRIVGVKGTTTRLRVVSRAFDKAVVETLLHGGLIDPTRNRKTGYVPRTLYRQMLTRKLWTESGKRSTLGRLVEESIKRFEQELEEPCQAPREEMVEILLDSIVDIIPIQDARLMLLSCVQPPVPPEKTEIVHGALILAASLGELIPIATLYNIYNPDRTPFRPIPSKYFSTFLIAAALHKQIKSVKFLLDLGVNPEEMTKYTNSLAAACTAGSVEIVQILLNAQNPAYGRPASYSWFEPARAAVRGKFTSIIHMLFDINDPSQQYKIQKLFYMACAHGNMEIFNWMLSEGADMEKKKRIINDEGYLVTEVAPIEMAAEKDQLEIVRELVERGVRPIDDGSALWKGTMEGHLDVKQFLLENEARVQQYKVVSRECLRLRQYNPRLCHSLEEWEDVLDGFLHKIYFLP